MKKHLSTILLILILLVGLSLLLYPTFSDWWNSIHQTRIIMDYDAYLKNMQPEDYTAYFDAADEYNRQIRQIEFPLMNYGQVEGYNDLLHLGSNGLMAYITIPKINVELPIYHGTSDHVLNIGVGHLEGTSLPVGGASTHSVLSAHRGLPSARLFTDLDKLVIGDIFTISVLDQVLTYQVDQILIVEPYQVESLYVTEGEDYCTLVTCTPYGINTQRMLVRGTRIENIEEAKVIRVTTDAVRIEPVIVAPFLAAPMLLILLFILMLPKPKR